VPTAAPDDDASAGERKAAFLSKSKYLWGLQCPKLLWHAYNAKHLIPEPAAAQQAVFDQGHEVGALAKRLYPDGIEIGEDVLDLEETVQPSECLRGMTPLFVGDLPASPSSSSPIAAAQRLRATDAWHGTETQSRGSLASGLLGGFGGDFGGDHWRAVRAASTAPA
jgi:hypothetical protein